jgi:hypothetical protein
MQFSENYDTVRTMTCKMMRSRSDVLVDAAVLLYSLIEGQKRETRSLRLLLESRLLC